MGNDLNKLVDEGRWYLAKTRIENVDATLGQRQQATTAMVRND
jgi:hypothetical protein